MKNLSTILENSKQFLFKHFSKDAGKMLLVTGAVGWAVSSIAQIFAIMTNDKVSKEQKKFMIPQEAADAAINIFAFVSIVSGVQTFTKWLAKSGKIITPEIKKICTEHNILFAKDTDGNTPDIGKSILKRIDEYQSTLKINREHNNVSTNLEKELKVKIDKLNKFYDDTYAPFENGLKVAGNVIGAVVSSNIITPMIRNPFAAAKQKQAMREEKLEQFEQMQKEQQLNPYSPVIPMQNKLVDIYKARMTSSPSGSMRV